MSPFNVSSDIPSLSGRVAIVTGGNRGMGVHIVEQLALHGAKVYMAARSEGIAQAAITQLESKNPTLKGASLIHFLSLDLSTVKGTKEAAKAYLSKESRLDILVHNAAVMSHPYTKTAEGLEDSFVVNHLAPFVFTKELFPLLVTTSKLDKADVRVITVSSDIHSLAPKGGKFYTLEEVNDPLASAMFRDNLLGRYTRYARSKLAGLLFTRQLQKEFEKEKSSALSIAVNPGGVATETVLNNMKSTLLVGPLLKFLVGTMARSPLDGASIALFAATAPEVRNNEKKFSGRFVADYKVVNGSKDSQDDALAEKLWKASNILSGQILGQ